MRKRWLLPAALAAALTFAAPAQAARDYVGLVNPWVEADIGRYFFFQSASSPFGFVKLRPDTSTHAVWGTGYRRNENEVKGFSHIHDWQFSGIQVMPTSGVLPLKTRGDTGWQSHVEHDDSEVAQPGYHRLHLDRYDITAELTSTDRVGIHRYRFEQDGPGEIIVNLGGKLGEANMKDAHVTRVGKRSIEGWVNQRGDGYASHDTKLFFDIRVDRPFDSMRGWVRDKLRDEPLDELSGDQMGVWLRYDHLRRGEVVQMKVALSLTGNDGATRNLTAEAPGWNFDGMRRAAQKRWNDMLGRVDVSGGTHQQQVKFYTDLFHVLCGRSLVSDADGRYMDDTWNAGVVRRADHGMYNYDALWLTQWNVNSMLGLAYPEVYSDFVKSQLQMYKDGGLLPRGPVAGNYSMVMTGSPVTSFITGAWNKGIRDFDVEPRLRRDDGRALRRRAVRQVRVRVRRLERARRHPRLPRPRVRAAGTRRRAAQRRRRADARVRAPGLGAGAARAAAAQARDQRRAVREGDGVVGECCAGDRRPAGAFGRRALERRPTARRGCGWTGRRRSR